MQRVIHVLCAGTAWLIEEDQENIYLGVTLNGDDHEDGKCLSCSRLCATWELVRGSAHDFNPYDDF